MGSGSRTAFLRQSVLEILEYKVPRLFVYRSYLSNVTHASLRIARYLSIDERQLHPILTTKQKAYLPDVCATNPQPTIAIHVTRREHI